MTNLETDQYATFQRGLPRELWNSRMLEDLQAAGFDGQRVTLFKSVASDSRSELGICEFGCERVQWKLGKEVRERHSSASSGGGGLYASPIERLWINEYLRPGISQPKAKQAIVVEARAEDILDVHYTYVKCSALTVLDIREASPDFIKAIIGSSGKRGRIGREARNWGDVIRIISGAVNMS